MKDNQKNTTIVLIIVGILLIIAALAYYFAMKKGDEMRSNNQPVVENSNNPTASPMVSGSPSGSFITLKNPKGGELLRTGTTVTIQWISSGVSKVCIDLINGAHDDGTLGGTNNCVDATLGTYTWTVPNPTTWLAAGQPENNYQLFIYSADSINTKDFSGTFFIRK